MEEAFTSFVNAAAIVSAGMLVGMLIGYAFARGGQGKAAKPAKVVDSTEYEKINGDYETLSVEYDTLRSEYDGYRGRVENHFRETSEAFQKTTEQYRSLYQQIASGAVELCDPEAVKPILDSAASTSNAISNVAVAHTSFPRSADLAPGEGLGTALEQMRAEMTELDRAIDDLKADVIEPKRKELQERGLTDTPEPVVEERTTPILRHEPLETEPALDVKINADDSITHRLDVRPAASTPSVSAPVVSEPVVSKPAPAPTPVRVGTLAAAVLIAKEAVAADNSDADSPDTPAKDAKLEIPNLSAPEPVQEVEMPAVSESTLVDQAARDYSDLPPMTFGGREVAYSDRRIIDDIVEDTADAELVMEEADTGIETLTSQVDDEANDMSAPADLVDQAPATTLVPRRRLADEINDPTGRANGKRIPRLVPDRTNGMRDVYDFIDDDASLIRLER